MWMARHVITRTATSTNEGPIAHATSRIRRGDARSSERTIATLGGGADDHGSPEENQGESRRHGRNDERRGCGPTKADGREGLGQLRNASFRDWRAHPSILTHA